MIANDNVQLLMHSNHGSHLSYCTICYCSTWCISLCMCCQNWNGLAASTNSNYLITCLHVRMLKVCCTLIPYIWKVSISSKVSCSTSQTILYYISLAFSEIIFVFLNGVVVTIHVFLFHTLHMLVIWLLFLLTHYCAGLIKISNHNKMIDNIYML